MKNTKKGIMVASMMLTAASLSTNVFAANDYGIDYDGGEPLSATNVTINPDLIDGLTPLFKTVISKETTYSNSNKWENGYIWIQSSSTCKATKYFRVSGTKTVGPSDNLKASLSNQKYSVDIDFKKVSVENYVDDGKDYAVVLDNNWVDGMSKIFSDETCETALTDIKTSGLSQGSKLFIEINVKLRKKGTTPVFTSDELYFGIVDIDAAQSYKILNPTNLMTKDNMFARAAADLQDDNPEAVLKNMYVGQGNYIYSQFNLENTQHTVASNNKSNVFVKLNQKTQEDGVDIVFGFASGAGSRVDYYAKQYTIKYISDKGGEITGITEENVIAGQNPLGTEEKTKDGYEFEYWIADKDIILADDTAIEAGKPITIEQMKLVVANQDITFTAIHKEKKSDVAVPDTGAFTQNIEPATIASISVIGVLALALFIRTLPHLTHKSIKFD